MPGPQILQITRDLPKETMSFEPFIGIDGDGQESYDTPLSFEANRMEYDAATKEAEQFVVLPDGSRVRTPVTLYVQGDETNVPAQEDRVTLPDSRTMIVAERKTVAGLYFTPAEPDHYRLRLRL